MRLVESDIPKVLPGEARRFLVTPGFPPLGVENVRTVQGIAQFDVVNRSPLVFLVSVGVRFGVPGGEIWSDTAVEFIGPLGRDEYQVPIPGGATVADVRVGLFPFEVALARAQHRFPRT